MQKISKIYNKAVDIISSTKFFSYLILCLMILLFIGTIAQKNIGLYLAHQKYFASFIVMIGGIIPFPGGYLLMSLMTIGLSLKLAREVWEIRKIGTIVIHLGVLTLLVGSALTSMFSYEGNILIQENTSANHISDYYHNELVIYQVNETENQLIFKEEINNIKENQIIQNDSFPFDLRIIDINENSEIIKRNEQLDNAAGFAKIFRLEEKKSAENYEENMASISYIVLAKNFPETFYSTFEGMPIEQILELEDKEYLIEIRKIQTQLPFAIFLDDFVKENYQGTNKAKEYKSHLTIIEDNQSWKATVSMNQPLRYKGYSFYQSSYINVGGTEYTVLAVVRNVGRLFPYISTIIIALGILLHLVQHLQRRK